MYTSSATFFFFFFNDTATTEIYSLSLHDALPIYPRFDEPRGVDDVRRTIGTVLALRALRRVAADLQSGEIGRDTSELQSPDHLVCRLLLEKKKKNTVLQTTTRL